MFGVIRLQPICILYTYFDWIKESTFYTISHRRCEISITFSLINAHKVGFVNEKRCTRLVCYVMHYGIYDKYLCKRKSGKKRLYSFPPGHRFIEFLLHTCYAVKKLYNGPEKQHAANKQALFADNFGLTPVFKSVVSCSAWLSSMQQDYLLFGEPLRAFATKSVMETHRWPRIELGYSNNAKDWAIRMVMTYRRFASPMVSRQRLNGNRSMLKV